MEETKLEQDLVSFWDREYGQNPSYRIEKSDYDPNDAFLSYAKKIGDSSEKILDIGTGDGLLLLASKCFGSKVKEGLGIDPSKTAIGNCRESAKMSGLEGLTFEVGDNRFLSSLPAASFDAVMISNVLDVVPPKVSLSLIQEIQRLVKKGGLVLVKVNFFLDGKMIARTKTAFIGENCYTIDGILRSYNLKDEEWIEKMKPLKLAEKAFYARLGENGPKDRIFLFKA
ncbi:MAG: class I SAM-dependent methyltransferase [Bacilli bacterium]